MSDLANLLGRVVAGKFTIEEHVGAGAMGEVFRARHVALDTIVALKIMRPDIAKDPMFKERFYREAKAASRLEHANSVRVLDYGVEPDGLVYIAMEFLHGRDLLSVLRDEWPLPDARIVDILVQALSAVSVAHELGIIHRDLKPENIMVNVGADDDGQRPYHVKVCDFGIAKLSDPRAFESANDGKALTSSGTLIGTPEYMSPEQARGDVLDARSDIYSVGIILYQLLVGRVPFSAENALGVVLKQVTDEPVLPSLVRRGVNARLEAICMRALKKSREERYQTAKEMRRDLRTLFGSSASAVGESGAHVPAVAPLEMDGASAVTVVYTDSATSPTQVAGSLPASSSGAASGKDFAPKQTQTSDGTEVTVPLRSGHRYLGAILAVGAVSILLGAVAVFALRTPDSHASTPPIASVSASESAAADAPPAPAAEEPSTTPLALASGSPSASAHRATPKTGPPVVSAKAVSAKAPPATGTTAGALTAPAPAATVTTAPNDFNPASAYVALGTLSRERVREDVVRKKMGDLLPRLSGCYRDALMMVGAPIGGSAEIHMSIDEKGGITAIVNAPKLPQFARCAQGILAGQKLPVTALEVPVSAGATASQWLALHP